MKEQEVLQRPTTGNFAKLEISEYPNEGGTFIPSLRLADTLVIATATNRNLPSQESQIPHPVPVEISPNLTGGDVHKWDSLLEMNRFINHINAGFKEGKTLLEAVAVSTKELETNVRGYDREIIKTKGVLPHSNRFGRVDGETRMVGNNGRPVVDSVSPKERRGSVLEASRTIETHLVTAENNSFGVLPNPDGWHGYTDAYGNELSPHRNAQFMVFWKNKTGQLNGLTFHIDLDLAQAENTMAKLGVPERSIEGRSEKDRIIDVVRNPALLPVPATYDNPFDYVLDVMLSVRGSHDIRLMQENGQEEIIKVSDIREDLKRFDALLKGSPKEEKLIADLVDFIMQNYEKVYDWRFQQQIIDKKEETLLLLTRQFLQDSGQMTKYQPPYVSYSFETGFVPDLRLVEANFAAERAYLRTRAGCPPSGSSVLALAGISLGSESGGVSTEESIGAGADQYGSLVFYHEECKSKPPHHGKNTRPPGILRTHYQCCGKEIPRC